MGLLSDRLPAGSPTGCLVQRCKYPIPRKLNPVRRIAVKTFSCNHDHPSVSGPLESASRRLLHHPNLLLRQPVEPVDDLVDEPVGGAVARRIILSRGRVALGIPGAGAYAFKDVLEGIKVLGYLLVDLVQEGRIGAAEGGQPLETLVTQGGRLSKA